MQILHMKLKHDVNNINASTKLIPADTALLLYSQELNNACSYMFSILLNRCR